MIDDGGLELLHRELTAPLWRPLDAGWWPLVFLILASSAIALIYVGRVLEVAA